MPNSPDRIVALQGASNFRDLGGYMGLHGRPLRWRRLFRAPHLAGLTSADQATLAGLGITRALDFRGVDERAATPYAVPGIAQHSLSIEPSVTQSMQDMVAAGQRLTAPVVADLMRELYRALVNDHAPRYAELFAHLLDGDDAPLVFHCTAGKDRTGVAAALLLLALGVSREVVMADFLLTNLHYRHPVLPPSGTAPEVLAVLWSVQDNFLHAAWDALDRDQGGIERYLAQRMGLTALAQQALQTRFLAAA